MNTNHNSDTRSARLVAGVGVPGMVAYGLARVRTQQARVREQVPTSELDAAIRADRLVGLAVREARWWDVLWRWTYSAQHQVPLIYGAAVMAARAECQASAHFYREVARDHRRRAAGVPVCSVIGCGCGGTCDQARAGVAA